MTDRNLRQYRQRDDPPRSPRSRSPRRAMSTDLPRGLLGAEYSIFADENPEAIARVPCHFCSANPTLATRAQTHSLASCGHFTKSPTSVRSAFMRNYELSTKQAVKPKLSKELFTAAVRPPGDIGTGETDAAAVLATQPCPWCQQEDFSAKKVLSHCLQDCREFATLVPDARHRFIRAHQTKSRTGPAGNQTIKKSVPEPEKKADEKKPEAVVNPTLQAATPAVQQPACVGTEVQKNEGVAKVQDLRQMLDDLSSTMPGSSRLQVAQALRARWQQDLFKMQGTNGGGWLGGVPPLEAIMLEALQMWIEKEEGDGGT